MNLIPFRVGLRHSQFPMLSGDIGETVVDAGVDFHSSGLPADQGSESQHNTGKPQVMYLENAIAIAEGYTTVCYKDAPPCCVESLGDSICDTVRVPRPRQCCTFYLHLDEDWTVATVHHRVFAYQKGSKYLMELHNKACCTPPIDCDEDCHLERDDSRKEEKEQACKEACEALKVAPDSCTITPIEIKCLKTECLIGITATDNRLIMYSDDAVMWGNIESGKEEDFFPSFTNGANTVKPSDLLGRMIFAAPIGDGVAFYGSENAVYLDFSGDTHNKYKFRELPGVGGITDKKHVGWQGNTLYHYVWSSNGLQLVHPTRQARLMFPPVSEFLQGNVIEDYREATCEGGGIENNETTSAQCVGKSCTGTAGLGTCNTPPPVPSYINERDDTHKDDPCGYPTVCPHILESVVPCESGLNKKIQIVGTNYLAISYGRGCDCVYDYILLYDERLDRWGKLKIRHRAVFEMPESSATSHNVAITTEAGDIVVLDTNHVTSVDCSSRDVKSCVGVVVLGRFSLSRRVVSELHTVSVQRVHPEAEMQLRAYPSYDGFTSITAVPSPCEEVRNTGVRAYVTRSSGFSHTIELTGTFKLTSLVLGFKYNGRNNR